MSTINDIKMGSLENDNGIFFNLQRKFAALQLLQARACKSKASEYIQVVKDSQDKANECSDQISAADSVRVLKAKDKKKDVPESFINYCREHNIDIPEVYTEKQIADNKKLNKKDPNYIKNMNRDWDYESWDVALRAIRAYQETLTSHTQTNMVLLNDFTAQYNSYLEGANKACTDGSSTMRSVLTRSY